MSSFTKQIPNLLTFSRLAIAGAVWWLIINQVNYLAAGLVFLGAMTDLFDGILARKLKATSSFGYFADHIIDLVYLGPICYLAAKYLNFFLFLLISTLTGIVAFLSIVTMKRKKANWPNVWGKTAFGFLIASGCVALVSSGLPNIWKPYFSWIDIANIVLGIAIILRITSIIVFLKEVFKKRS